MQERKITDLVVDALNEDDYEFRINFLLAGLMSEEGNDTPEKEENNRKFLADVQNYLKRYDGDAEKAAYANRIADAINSFLSAGDPDVR